MKYYPLECLDNMDESETPEHILQMIIDTGLCDKDVTIKDLYDYVFSPLFFTSLYNGKFKQFNHDIRFNKAINKKLFPMYSMKQVDQRSTEWKDILSTSIVLDRWKNFKMVYKIDNDFFHEIKRTDNLTISKDTFNNMPFDCFFIDLTEVENISDFKGVFAYLIKHDENSYSVNLYMVQGEYFVFFTYYAYYAFNDKTNEIEWNPNDIPKSDFIARTFVASANNESLLKDVSIDMNYEYDPRTDIVIAIFQIMQFIAIDASDVSENTVTKSTYRPRVEGQKPKNKFSEVRMWDVGIRYGKAIRVAKQEYNNQIARENAENNKNRKPVRPHVRRAHWHKYKVGKGRQETKIIWLAPIYVCGSGKEIPVTIREVKK